MVCMKDLTKGNPLKSIILFALPLLAGSLLQQFYSLADTRIVGMYLGLIPRNSESVSLQRGLRITVLAHPRYSDAGGRGTQPDKSWLREDVL